jgi:hypothetical protein
MFLAPRQTPPPAGGDPELQHIILGISVDERAVQGILMWHVGVCVTSPRCRDELSPRPDRPQQFSHFPVGVDNLLARRISEDLETEIFGTVKDS